MHFTSILPPIIANISPIEIFNNLFLEKHKGSNKFFVKQARLAKKQKFKIKFEKKDYVVSLKKVMNTIGGKYTICIVEKHFIISIHDYMANHCTHLDFGQFL